MDRPEPADLEGLIEALLRAEVDFLVVGGAAAVLHGAPTTTWDLDIVYSRTEENLDRLTSLLEELQALVRDPGGRELRPSRSHLEAAGQLRLLTDLGPMDLLGRLHDGRGYDELLAHSQVVGDEDFNVRLLDLDTLIEVKMATGRAKDKLMVPALLALRDDIGEGD